MIINIKNKEDLITLDFSLKQIRYLKNFEDKDKTEIYSINLYSSDIEGYSYLFENDKKLFLKTLRKDILYYMKITIRDFNFIINIKDLEVLENEKTRNKRFKNKF